MSEYPKVMTHPNAVKAQITAIESRDAAGRVVRDYTGTADKFPPVTVSNKDQEDRHRAQGYVTAEDQVKQQSYEDYPVWLRHTETQEAVLATSAASEAEYQTQGYERPGKGDPDAVRKAFASPHVPGRTTEEWPKVVNGVVIEDPAKSATGLVEYPKWIHDPTKKQESILANNRHEEELAKEKLGIPNEVGASAAEEVETDPVRESLLALAQTKGVEISADWSNEEIEKTLYPGSFTSGEDEEKEEVDISSIEDKDELIALAKERGVKFDKRWSVAKFQSVLLAA